MTETADRLNTEILDHVNGGILTSEDMNWYTNMIKDAKRQGCTLEYFIQQGGNEPQVIEFVRFMWDRI